MADETISDRVREIGDGLILAFPITNVTAGGQTNLNTVRAYFFRVARKARYFQQYESLGNITSGSTTPANGFDWLGDTGVGSGSDIFRNETNDWHVLHFGVGTNHPELKVYTAVSPRANGNPALDRDGNGEDITPGTTERGWYSLKQFGNKFDPPAFTERVSFRNDDDGEFLMWSFFNDGPNNLTGEDTRLFFTGAGYDLIPVIDEGTQDVMLNNAIRRPENPAIDTVMVNTGGMTDYQLGTEEPDAWGSTTNLTRDLDTDDMPTSGV